MNAPALWASEVRTQICNVYVYSNMKSVGWYTKYTHNIRPICMARWAPFAPPIMLQLTFSLCWASCLAFCISCSLNQSGTAYTFYITCQYIVPYSLYIYTTLVQICNIFHPSIEIHTQTASFDIGTGCSYLCNYPNNNVLCFIAVHVPSLVSSLSLWVSEGSSHPARVSSIFFRSLFSLSSSHRRAPHMRLSDLPCKQHCILHWLCRALKTRIYIQLHVEDYMAVQHDLCNHNEINLNIRHLVMLC